MNNYDIESSFSVWDNNEDVRIKVGVDPDVPDIIMISTPDEKDKEYYGPIRFSMCKEQALKFIEAIKLQIDMMEKFDI